MLYFGILLFTFLIFVQPQDFVPILKGQPLVALVMGMVGLGWFFKRMSSRQDSWGKANQNTLVIAFWGLAVFSAVQVGSMFTYDTFIEWGKTVLIYFMLIYIIDTKQRLRGFLWAIVMSMAVTGILGILQSYGIDYTGLGTHLGGRIRGVGIFGTNQLAYALGFCTPLAFALFITADSPVKKFILMFVFAIYFYGIYLTQSRGGLLCLLAVALLTFSFFSKRRSVKVAGAVICAVVFVLFVQFAPRFSSTLDYQSDGSAMGRLDAWGGGLMALKDNPLGIGYCQFVPTFRISAHNSYIETVTELGFAGLFVWLGFFYYSFRNLRLISNNGGADVNKEITIYSKSLQISLYAYLIGSYFSASSYYIPLFMLIAVAVILQRLSHLFRHSAFSWKDMRNIAAIETAVLIVIHIMV